MSWYSQLLTNTTSRITNLQRTLLANENDGDTEDDTNVCRVLRAYYTEKGRAFPAWLPPDPKAPPPQAPIPQQQQIGSRYGGLVSQPGAGGQLSSLWDNNPVNQRQDPQSLRQGRGAPPPMRGSESQQISSRNPFANRNSGPQEDIPARPLPSQRAGSYQQANIYARNNSDSSASGAGSAQDRLKQRLWGGARTASPATGGPFQPPAQQASKYGGGGGGGDYEERFAPGGMYDASGGSGGAYGSRGSEKPFMSSNSPWSSGGADYGGGGAGGGGGGGGGRMGLPNGPRRGLPSGPRMR